MHISNTGAHVSPEVAEAEASHSEAKELHMESMAGCKGSSNTTMRWKELDPPPSLFDPTPSDAEEYISHKAEGMELQLGTL
jgi:hypothetical protein